MGLRYEIRVPESGKKLFLIQGAKRHRIPNTDTLVTYQSFCIFVYIHHKIYFHMFWTVSDC
jgi:hypothetical protein